MQPRTISTKNPELGWVQLQCLNGSVVHPLPFIIQPIECWTHPDYGAAQQHSDYKYRAAAGGRKDLYRETPN